MRKDEERFEYLRGVLRKGTVPFFFFIDSWLSTVNCFSPSGHNVVIMQAKSASCKILTGPLDCGITGEHCLVIALQSLSCNPGEAEDKQGEKRGGKSGTACLVQIY